MRVQRRQVPFERVLRVRPRTGDSPTYARAPRGHVRYGHLRRTARSAQDRVVLDDDHFAALLSAPDYLPFRGLEEILALRALLARLERRLVAAARADGCTWQEIGEVLGCTRQTARRRAEEDA